MAEPKSIKDLMVAIAADPKNEYAAVLRKCPFMQAELMSRGLMSFDDLTTEESDRLVDWHCKTHPEECNREFLDHLLDNQDVMIKLHISQRTLQTLRSNGTIPYVKIGHKIWYHRLDIERILRNNYVMFNIRQRYGEDD
jgi:hypothetical protein